MHLFFSGTAIKALRALLIHMNNRLVKVLLRSSEPRKHLDKLTLDKNPLKYEYLLRAHSGVSRERELKVFGCAKRKMHFISQKKNCAIKITRKISRAQTVISRSFSPHLRMNVSLVAAVDLFFLLQK